MAFTSMKSLIMATLSRAILLSLTTSKLATAFPSHATRHQCCAHSRLTSLAFSASTRSKCASSSLASASSPFAHLTGLSRCHDDRHARSSTTRCFASSVEPNDAGEAPSTAATKTAQKAMPSKFHHTLAVLTLPTTSMDRIANEAILDTAAERTISKLSIMLRCEDDFTPTLASLRRYVGEVYSCLWDVALGMGNPDDIFDVVVYAQNLPNSAPESWIHHQADLDCVCSHDSLMGWISTNAQGRGVQYQSLQGRGQGGLDAHVTAINADRQSRDLHPVHALHVDPWPIGATTSPSDEMRDDHIIFLDDDNLEPCIMSSSAFDDPADDADFDGDSFSMLGGPRITQEVLFDHVAVGGTFDGMHYGHRKLLTLAISSVNPMTGKLMIGVTVDAMLTHKAYADQIPEYEERRKGAQEFVYRFAPGMKNRIQFVPISDAFGPAGNEKEGASFDALVLSHETLENGYILNQHRTNVLGMEPLTLLCTRRTEPHGMSSTALRRLRSRRNVAKQ